MCLLHVLFCKYNNIKKKKLIMIKETENKCSNYYCNNTSQKIAKFLDQDISFCDGCFDLY